MCVRLVGIFSILSFCPWQCGMYMDCVFVCERCLLARRSYSVINYLIDVDMEAQESVAKLICVLN